MHSTSKQKIKSKLKEVALRIGEQKKKKRDIGSEVAKRLLYQKYGQIVFTM